MTNFNQPNVSEQKKIDSSILRDRDAEKNRAGELEKSIAEAQTARFEATLFRLMRRTGNNPELVNALNNLTKALEHRSNFGQSEEQLSTGGAASFAEFLNKTSDELMSLSGNRPADPSAWRK